MRTKSKIIFLIVLLLAACAAFGQSNYPSSAQFSSMSWYLQNPPFPVPSASVSLVGKSGTANLLFLDCCQLPHRQRAANWPVSSDQRTQRIFRFKLCAIELDARSRGV